ncbi:MAG TPA: hypothetical protein VI814_07085 [Candidatus Limnocylindria bacterium]
MDQKAKDLAFTLKKDRPGELAKAITAIANMQINIEGFCEIDGKVHLVASDPANAKKALETVGFSVEESDLFVIDAQDRPGFLAEILRKVSDEEVSVVSSYTLTKTRIALTVDQPARLKEILRDVTPAQTRSR